MKRFIVIATTLVILCVVCVMYYKSKKAVDTSVAMQIQGINSQVTEFETRYSDAKTKGDTYLEDILTTCMTNKPTDNFRALYQVQEATHDGGELDFCYALENSLYWDDYQLYCIDYAKAHNIRVPEIADKVQEFEALYSSYDKQSEEWAILMNTMPFYDNYYTFNFYDYTVTNVNYFATMNNDYITQLIEITGMNDIPMTIEVLWSDGKIQHIVRRL